MESCWSAEPKKRPTFSEILFRLDEALVDASIDDEQGRAFWKQYFLIPKGELQDKVTWAEFVRTVCRATKIKDRTRLEPLQKLLSDEGRVSMEKFNQVIVWFGRFFTQTEAENALDVAMKMVNAEWYAGQ
jgi:hypothetical protein